MKTRRPLFVLLASFSLLLVACQDPNTSGDPIPQPRVASWGASTWDDARWE